MRRWIAVLWQASFVVIAGVLYFLFVLPRWNELTGDWSHGLGTAMRIVAGVLVGLAALPVAFTLIRTRKPEYGTPTLALSLRLWSIVLHVLGGVLIVGAAIAEIWLSLDDAGQWLFGSYGAAAAIVLLGALAFYLAYVAEMTPPPPKPLKPKVRTRGRGKRKAAADSPDSPDTDDAEATVADEAVITSDDESPEDSDAESESAAETVEATIPTETVAAKTVAAKTVEATIPDETVADETVEVSVPTESTEPEPEPATEAEPAAEADSPEKTSKLRNRRPTGKTSSRLRRRSRGGVAVED
jgi:hypothetical protein